MAQLILLRHGKSLWNHLNLFTGWVDVPLAPEGVQEALNAGKKIAHLPIDLIYTSTLIRAQMTCLLAMTEHHSQKVPIVLHQEPGRITEWSHFHGSHPNMVPVTTAWELNERMYGDLQGLNKEETVKKFGEEQVHIWRRSYDIAPPHGESLKDTSARTWPYFQREILSQLKAGKNCFVAAHGNSLRSIIMNIEQLTPEEILKVELPTGAPLLYLYQNGKFSKETI